MSYTKIAATSANASWASEDLYTKLSYSAANASWEEGPAVTPVGTAAGDSSASGEGQSLATSVGSGISGSLCIAIPLSIGFAFGEAITDSEPLALITSSGYAEGDSLVSGIGLTNRGIGTAVGSSLAFVDTSKGNGLAIGGSTAIGQNWARSRFPPIDLWPDYSIVDGNLVIPISNFVGLSSDEASVVTGSWLDIVQAILLSFDSYMEDKNGFDTISTVASFVLNNYNFNHREIGRCVKTTIKPEFSIKHSFSDIVTENN